MTDFFVGGKVRTVFVAPLNLKAPTFCKSSHLKRRVVSEIGQREESVVDLNRGVR